MHKQHRTNTAMARLVEEAILHDMSHGSVVAWKFLASHHAPPDLILRVLGDPSQRRATDLPSASISKSTGSDAPQAGT